MNNGEPTVEGQHGYVEETDHKAYVISRAPLCELVNSKGPKTTPFGAQMSQVDDITDANFDAEVLQSDKPVLIDFWATWCAPCKALSPAVHSLADEHADTLKVVKLDIQANMKTALHFKVNSIPTLIVIKGGKEVARQTGAAGGIQALRRLVASHI